MCVFLHLPVPEFGTNAKLKKNKAPFPYMKLSKQNCPQPTGTIRSNRPLGSPHNQYGNALIPTVLYCFFPISFCVCIQCAYDSMLYAISWGELDSMMRTLFGRLHLERHATKIVLVSQKGTAFRPFKLRTSLPERRRHPRNDSNQNVWLRHTTVAGASLRGSKQKVCQKVWSNHAAKTTTNTTTCSN